MGEETPESVEIKCPGCGTRFRLTPKKGRLPSGDVPCPKCYEEIPVADATVFEAEDTVVEEAPTSESAPQFGVVKPGRGKSDDDESDRRRNADEAIAKLEQMAGGLDPDSKSTMAGLPGAGANPFAESREQDKTDSVDVSELRKVAAENGGDDKANRDEPRSEISASFAGAKSPKTTSRKIDEQTARALSQETSEVSLSEGDLDATPTALRRDQTTARRQVDRSKLRETAENQSVSPDMVRDTAENESITPKMVEKSREKSGDGSGSPNEKLKGQASDSSILARIKKRTISKKLGKQSKKGGQNKSRPAGEATSPSIDLEKLKEKSAARKSKSTKSTDPKSLSDLFSKVRKKRGTDSGSLRKKLRQSAARPTERKARDPSPASVDLGDELSDSELADIVDQSTREEEHSDSPAGQTDHSGLFDDVSSDDGASNHGASASIEEVSRDKGPTSESMLARLQKRRDRGDNIDPIEVGSAGERRGSGYIRLPTSEIQDVLGYGDFRLKIEGVIYEPVDKEGLIQLIKGGVLLGAEEIAESDGDWMPVSEHPVFGELRRKMAAEAHEVLSRMGSSAKKAAPPLPKAEDEKPSSTQTSEPSKQQADSPPPNQTSPPSAPPDKPPSASDEEEIPPEPATMELSRTETAALVTGMTDKLHAIGGTDESQETEEPDEPEGGFPTVESFEAIPVDMEASGDVEQSTEGMASVQGEEQLEGADDFFDDGDEFDDGVDEASGVEEDGDSFEDDFEDDFFDDEPFDEEPFDEEPFDEEPFDDEPFDDEPPPEAIDSGPTAAPLSPEISTSTPSPPADIGAEDELLAAEDALEELESKKKRSPLAIIGILLVVVLAGAVAMILTEPGQEIVEDLTGWSPAELLDRAPVAEEASDETIDPAVAEAVANSMAIVADSIPADRFSDEARIDNWIEDRIAAGDYNAVREVMLAQWDEGRREREFLLELAGVLTELGDFRRARRVAMTGLIDFPQDREFVDAHITAIRADESLSSYDAIHLADGSQYRADGLYDVSDHRGFLLESPEYPDKKLLFKPENPAWAGDWQSEVAAWRFCELVICHFDVFRVEPAVMTREFLEELQGDTDGYAPVIAQADWMVLDIDGEDVEAVRGSLEYLPAEQLPPFPIEFRPLWINWVSAGVSTEALDEPVTQNMARLADLADGRFHDALVPVLEDISTSSVARQVSTLLLFDFLTNNWERFFTRSENYGLNNPVHDGHLVSRHNGDAFQPRSSRRVRGRFEWTTRFSRSTVASIRALERELTFEVLFPEARATDRRLQVMWSQRQELLDRVDELSARHGEEDVLLFP